VCETRPIEAEGDARVLFTDYDVLGPIVLGTLAMEKGFIVMSRERDGIREVTPFALPRPRDRSCRDFVGVREALRREFRWSTH
jgi:glycine cleavage system aminomethyltransferase T